jgi:hypothetical protein
MSDFQAVDITYANAPAFVQRVRDRGVSPEDPRTAFAGSRTYIVNDYVLYHSGDPPSGGRAWALHIFAGTPTDGRQKLPSAAVQNPVEAASAARVRMLAKKYETGATPEDLARLEILTNRLSKLAPRTTGADIAKVEATVDQLAQITEQVDTLAAEYDI